MESTLSLNLLFCNCSASFYCVFGIHITCCSGKRLYWLIRQISSMILTQVFVLLWIDHKSLSLVCVQWIYEESIEFQNSIKKHKKNRPEIQQRTWKTLFSFFFPVLFHSHQPHNGEYLLKDIQLRLQCPHQQRILLALLLVCDYPRSHSQHRNHPLCSLYVFRILFTLCSINIIS